MWKLSILKGVILSDRKVPKERSSETRFISGMRSIFQKFENVELNSTKKVKSNGKNRDLSFFGIRNFGKISKSILRPCSTRFASSKHAFFQLNEKKLLQAVIYTLVVLCVFFFLFGQIWPPSLIGRQARIKFTTLFSIFLNFHAGWFQRKSQINFPKEKKLVRQEAFF